MRALVQRVTSASVRVEGRITGAIECGYLVLVGATHEDQHADADWLANKIAGLRLFPDEAGHMNRDLAEVGGKVLAVPQFTLYGDARRGRRPDFVRAARPEPARALYERFCETLAAAGIPVERGVFQAHMEVSLVNDGPVTMLIESPAAAGSGDPA
jgi:D-tyrosyl-tRNA(Tyr) deacylase